MADERQSMNDVNLLDCLLVIWRRKAIIIVWAAAITLATAFASLLMTDIYRVTAVITPVGREFAGGGELSALTQQLGGFAGPMLSGSGSASEITSLLNSNILREKVIERNNLLPVLFSERWDEEKKDWKPQSRAALTRLRGLIGGAVRGTGPRGEAEGGAAPGDDAYGGAPTAWDGIRVFDEIVRVTHNVKDSTITVTVEYNDPLWSARIAEFFLSTLTAHMSGEAKRVAETNRKYLEVQLWSTTDPIIRQKIYNLIAQQIEISMMSEVKENFAFKVIDPPKAPDKKAKPRRLRMVGLGFAVSLVSGLFLAFISEFASNRR